MNAVQSVSNEDLRSERLQELTSKVVDGLSGDALKVAMDMGKGLYTEDGLANLLDKVEKYVSACKEDEARELFHMGSQTEGKFSRQETESMNRTLLVGDVGLHV